MRLHLLRWFISTEFIGATLVAEKFDKNKNNVLRHKNNVFAMDRIVIAAIIILSEK